MTKEDAVAKIVSILSKLNINDKIETYHTTGIWLHEEIDNHQKELGEKLNSLQAEKEKIKNQV